YLVNTDLHILATLFNNCHFLKALELAEWGDQEYNPHPSGCNSLNPPSTLQTLALFDSDYDASIDHLVQQCQSLQCIQFIDCRFPHWEMPQILQQIECLSYYNCRDIYFSVYFNRLLLSLDYLRELVLHEYDELSEDILSVVSQKIGTTLRRVELADCGDVSTRGLATLIISATKLEYLSIDSCKFDLTLFSYIALMGFRNQYMTHFRLDEVAPLSSAGIISIAEIFPALLLLEITIQHISPSELAGNIATLARLHTLKIKTAATGTISETPVTSARLHIFVQNITSLMFVKWDTITVERAQ
ncbi:hypothetical protein BC936DRAFT_140492, partial [Jimgerdemannia flammicorona]